MKFVYGHSFIFEIILIKLKRLSGICNPVNINKYLLAIIE